MPDSRGPSFQVLENLRARQVEAWRRGEPLLVEVLVRDVSPPLVEPELLELIASEATLRGELGETCTSVEYIQRFPQLAEAIEQILGTQRTMKFTSSKTHSPITLAIDEPQKTARKPEKRLAAGMSHVCDQLPSDHRESIRSSAEAEFHFFETQVLASNS